MSEENLDETLPVKPEPDEEVTQAIAAEPEDSPPEEPESKGKKAKRARRPWVRWLATGAAIFVVVVGLGALGGYRSGIQERLENEEVQRAVNAVTQFELGMQDMQAGRYDFARQRFEYVIRMDPNYPGAAEQLAFALLALQSTATNTPIPAPTLTPTPDLRDAEALFAQAESNRQSEDWNALLNTLDQLRKTAPTYKTVEVDSMYYLGLRKRGEQRILVDGDLEGGIYDLNRAEQVGPLDVEAQGYRQWASWYMTGLSFWGLDWLEAINYFSQVASAAPSLFDSSYITAQERLASANYEYSLIIIAEADSLYGRERWCEAYAKYEEAAGYYELSPDVQAAADDASLQCNPPAPTATPTP